MRRVRPIVERANPVSCTLFCLFGVLESALLRLMTDAEQYLERWHRVGLPADGSVEAIRAYEVTQLKPSSRQWQVLVALILGGILLGAGVLLFVAAHWDAVSPLLRLILVLSMLVFFHGLGLVIRGWFSGLATAMHAIGTVSAGAAIALVGQIFNMQEHWPAAVLLWALCAAAGWMLLPIAVAILADGWRTASYTQSIPSGPGLRSEGNNYGWR